MRAENDVDGRLRALHDAYVTEVNKAVAENREDIVERLTDTYIDEGLRILLAAPAA